MRKALAILAVLAVGCGGASKGDAELGDPESGITDTTGDKETIEQSAKPDGPAFPHNPGDLVVGPVDPKDPGGLTQPPNDGTPDLLDDEFGKERGPFLACYCIEDEKNISEIFIDFGGCDVGEFRVFALTPFYDDFVEFTDALKVDGGPCVSELDRDYWFVLPGPDRSEPQELHEAVVCVLLPDGEHKTRVGYHADGTCGRASRTYLDETKHATCGALGR